MNYIGGGLMPVYGSGLMPVYGGRRRGRPRMGGKGYVRKYEDLAELQAASSELNAQLNAEAKMMDPPLTGVRRTAYKVRELRKLGGSPSAKFLLKKIAAGRKAAKCRKGTGKCKSSKTARAKARIRYYKKRYGPNA